MSNSDVTSAVATVTASLIDFARVRLSGSTAANIKAEKALVTIPVERPARHTWFRVHPDETYRIDVAIIEDRENMGAQYVLDQTLCELHAQDLVRKTVVTCVSRHGGVFLWPLRIPDAERPDNWGMSAQAAAEHAEMQWTRIVANLQDGRYDVMTAIGDLGEPVWPKKSFEELFGLAFKDRYISDPEHPMLRKLLAKV